MSANRKTIEAVAHKLSSDALQLVSSLEETEGQEVRRLQDWFQQQQTEVQQKGNLGDLIKFMQSMSTSLQDEVDLLSDRISKQMLAQLKKILVDCHSQLDVAEKHINDSAPTFVATEEGSLVALRHQMASTPTPTPTPTHTPAIKRRYLASYMPTQSSSSSSPPPATPKRQRLATPATPLADRQVEFDDVYQGGKANNKREILEFEGFFYYVECTAHDIIFNGRTHSFKAASKHLRGSQHLREDGSNSSGQIDNVVKQLGVHVKNCSLQDAIQNNKALQRHLVRQTPKCINTGDILAGFVGGGLRPAPVVVLPVTGSTDRLELPPELLEQFLSRLPACVEYDKESKELRGWKKEYESGANLESQRLYPVLGWWWKGGSYPTATTVEWATSETLCLTVIPEGISSHNSRQLAEAAEFVKARWKPNAQSKTQSPDTSEGSSSAEDTQQLEAADHLCTRESKTGKTVARFTMPSPSGEGDEDEHEDEEEDSRFCEPLNICRANTTSPSPTPWTPPNMEGLDQSRIGALLLSLENGISTQGKHNRTTIESCSIASRLSRSPKICSTAQTGQNSLFRGEQSTSNRATQAQVSPAGTPVTKANKSQEGSTPSTRAVNKQQSWTTPARESFEHRRMAKMQGAYSPLGSPRSSQTRR